MTTKFLYKNEGPINEVLLNALDFSISFNQPIHIVFPKKGDFHQTNLGEILNELFRDSVPNISKKLVDGEKIGNFDLLLPSQINSQTSQGIVFAVYCTIEDVNKITSNSNPNSKIIYVSWLKVEADAWESIWKNKGLEIKHDIPNSQPISLNLEVEAVLHKLTKIINLSTGLAHPRDKEQAINEFKCLKQRGIKENPEYIGNWALANGWHAQHIDDLKKLADKYLS